MHNFNVDFDITLDAHDYEYEHNYEYNNEHHHKHDKNQSCEACEPFIKATELARAYVPEQKLCGVYQIDKALMKGTAFPELYRAYYAKYEKV